MKSEAKDRAQFLDNLMRRHLVFENFKYPAYTRVLNNGQLIPEFAGAFKTSITLPSRRFFGGGYGNNPWFDCGLPWWYGGRGSGE